MSKCFPSEEDAWRAAIEVRLEATECNLVIAHTTHRPGKGEFANKWRPVKTVIWRSGAGKAWFE